VIVLIEDTCPLPGRKIHSRGINMPNNKNTQKSGSQGTMGNKPDREFEGQGHNQGSGMGSKGHDQNSGMGSQGKQTSGSPGNFEDDEMTTSGGREGKFSDSKTSGEGQWSPGSSQESDR
jgi:hypothetical protein